MSSHSKLREHCAGVKPIVDRHGHWYRVTCPKCGKRVAYLLSDYEARQAWNAKMECEMKMKGQEE